MTITQDNLFSEPFSIVKNFLKNNVTDPRARLKADWLRSSMPLVTDKGFPGYPIIIIRNDVGEDPNNSSLAAETSNKFFRIQLRVLSDQATDIDSISNQIVGKFKDEDKLTEFGGKELSSSPIDWDLDMNGKKVLFRNIGFLFQERI